MYEVKHGGIIQKGDLIAVSNGNDFSLGIYYGNGRGGTVQYFMPGGIIQSRGWWERNNKARVDNNKQPEAWKISKVWKCYINSPRDTRIMKLNRENITDQETIDTILEAKEILQEFNITVNY